MLARAVAPSVLFLLCSTAGTCFAQSRQPWCVPGTRFCAQGNGNGGVGVGGQAQGQVGPNGASATGDANANANANADANADANAGANGRFEGQGEGNYRQRRRSTPSRFSAASTFCVVGKLGVFSGLKGGGCYAVSFRTPALFFEMETELLFGGTRHSTDWLFPMSFVVPLSSERSLYQGLQLRFGGSPIGVTFAKQRDGGTYVRFGLHAGVSYEWAFSSAAAWRVFDARTFLDFGTKREVDDRCNFLDFGAQLSTGLVL